MAKNGSPPVTSLQFELQQAHLQRCSVRFQSNALHLLPTAICSNMSAPNHILLTTSETQWKQNPSCPTNLYTALHILKPAVRLDYAHSLFSSDKRLTNSLSQMATG